MNDENDAGSGRYLDLLNLKSAEHAYQEVKKLASDLSDDEHLIRSCIFDLHAAVEVELRRIYFHMFKGLLFRTDDGERYAREEAALDKVVGRLSFMDMYRVLRPVLNSWPYPDLASISDINETRNQAAHGGNVSEVLYKGRNPFTDPDCFAQMYFDVWAIKHGSIPKFFDWTIETPRRRLRRYFERYGDI